MKFTDNLYTMFLILERQVAGWYIKRSAQEADTSIFSPIKKHLKSIMISSSSWILRTGVLVRVVAVCLYTLNSSSVRG